MRLAFGHSFGAIMVMYTELPLRLAPKRAFFGPEVLSTTPGCRRRAIQKADHLLALVHCLGEIAVVVSQIVSVCDLVFGQRSEDEVVMEN